MHRLKTVATLLKAHGPLVGRRWGERRGAAIGRPGVSGGPPSSRGARARDALGQYQGSLEWAGLTAPIVPLPQDSQRFILAPKGERASMPLTCASEHSCGSVLAPPMIYQPSACTGSD